MSERRLREEVARLRLERNIAVVLVLVLFGLLLVMHEFYIHYTEKLVQELSLSSSGVYERYTDIQGGDVR
jgi:hypothetical protein